MKISYKWLNELVDMTGIDAETIGERMSRTGIEVDDVYSPGEGLQKIVVGRTLEVIDHPDSDHLHVCQVDVGEEEAIQIVCGAPNIAKDQLVIVALHGARITGNAKIKKGKMRGQVSNGMICSLQELGYSDSVIPKKYADGIFVFPNDEGIKPGDDVLEVLGLTDKIIESDITPNRADALSMIGSAYEIGAVFNRPVNKTNLEVSTNPDKKIEDYISVQVDDKALAPVYNLLIVDGVEIKESPLWMQTRLMNAGIRPHNNIVDITNYVMLQYGQPLHAFDYDQIGSKEIIIRAGKEGETMRTLDGSERKLNTDDILITNGQEAIALAGVMGGLESEVNAQTTRVAIESAMFEPTHIRRTSKRFNLRSEASMRNERGVNIGTIQEAGLYAAKLMVELGGGEIITGIASDNAVEATDTVVETTTSYIRSIIGMAISDEDIIASLKQLGFTAELSDDVLKVTVPPRRWDISIPADIVEEVIRIYGYDRVENTLPKVEVKPVSLNHKQKLLRYSRQFFESHGLNQAISYSLTTPEQAPFMALTKNESITLAFPMSEDRSTLRQSIAPSLLEMSQYNKARNNGFIHFYEHSHVFYQDSEGKHEEERISGILLGAKSISNWNAKVENYDFFDVKGLIENYLDSLGLHSQTEFKATEVREGMHPGRTADILIDGKVIGYLGQVHPETARKYDLKEAFVFELDFNFLDLLTQAVEDTIQETIPKYPGMTRDIALLVDQLITHAEIEAVIRSTGGKYLKSVELFDIYEGDTIEAGKKSMAYSLYYLNLESTLVEDEVVAAFDKTKAALIEQLHVTIR